MIASILFFIINEFFVFTKENPISIIKEQQMLLGSSKTFIIAPLSCSEINIPNNYKKVEISLNSTNIFRLIITDEKIISCPIDNELGKCCVENATFCIEELNPLEISFNLNYCIDKSYIYACNDNNNTAELSLITKVIKDEGCQTTAFIDETECANLGIKTCKESKTCLNSCQYVECLNSKDDYLFSMCLPSNLTLNEISQKCENHLLFNKDGKNGKVLIQKCDNDNTQENDNDNFFHKIIKGFLVILGLFILIIFMSSIYYRIAMDVNRAPFNPPSFCPNFIYPRVNPNSIELIS